MIAQHIPPGQPAHWQRLYAEARITRPRLLQLLGLTEAAPESGGEEFPLRVPAGYIARMRPGDPDDPLLRQVLPVFAESMPDPVGLLDAVGDAAAEVVPGVLQKYQRRVLLILTGACAIHCRYCFRRNFPYAEQSLSPTALGSALAWLRQADDIDEVILSGGDPLSLSDDRLAAMVGALEAMPQLRRLRIHSRLPVVLPERVDEQLIGWLRDTRFPTVMVIHANHARELDGSVADGLSRLRQAGVTLLNQAVLLEGVNDNVDALADLSERLFELGVLPYYLHRLDRARGVGHFAVDDDLAESIMKGLRARLPGYLVPRYVVEVAGAESKLPA
jgi:EF-P beta-lysylation protein EpmB